MWNYIQLIGRITKDVELKKIGAYDMATFSLAQNRKVKDKEIAMYFDCKAWNKTGEILLAPGMSWYIPANERHRFKTDGCELGVVAYHPDSDFGPVDENHPMINRTII